MLAIALALAASAGYGASDFLAARLARRFEATTLVLLSQAAQALVLTTALLWRPLAPEALTWGAAAGGLNGIGLVLYYRALATGPAGVVTPLVASSMVVPAGVALAGGVLTDGWVVAALVVTIVGVIVGTAGQPEREPRATDPSRRYVAPALLATFAFGAFFVLLGKGAGVTSGSDADTLWAVLGVQLGALPVTGAALLWSRRRIAPTSRERQSPVSARGRLAPLALLSGLNLGGDVALAYALAAGDLGVVSVLASLGPVLTGALSQLLDGERLTARQATGAVLTFGGTTAIAYLY